MNVQAEIIMDSNGFSNTCDFLKTCLDHHKTKQTVLCHGKVCFFFLFKQLKANISFGQKDIQEVKIRRIIYRQHALHFQSTARLNPVKDSTLIRIIC